MRKFPKNEDDHVDQRSKQISHLLYSLPDEALVNEKQAAAFLGTALQTQRNWRHLGKGPAYHKLSPGPRGRVLYQMGDLRAYRDRCRIDPESN